MFFFENVYRLDLRNIHLYQYLWAVECTDCTSAEGEDPPSNECPDMTLSILMVRFQ